MVLVLTITETRWFESRTPRALDTGLGASLHQHKSCTSSFREAGRMLTFLQMHILIVSTCILLVLVVKCNALELQDTIHTRPALHNPQDYPNKEAPWFGQVPVAIDYPPKLQRGVLNLHTRLPTTPVFMH